MTGRDSGDGSRIVVAGGGTAGWLAAALLHRAWPRASISVVESPQIGRIGVGESSIPPLRRLLKGLGFDEADWMPACHATYKSSLHFVGWGGSRRGARTDYYHPLFRWGEDRPECFWGWLAGRRDHDRPDEAEPFDSASFLGVHLARGSRAPRPSVSDDGPLQYAYHLDAVLFADYLKDWAGRRGVNAISDTILDVELTPDGAIAGLRTEQHGLLAGDWFFDCSGFRGLLLNRALGEPFVSYADDLYCDAALALSAEHDRGRDHDADDDPAPGAPLSSETRATALSAGWCWDIPLQSRRGTGYVYASAYLDREQAERELRAHLGAAAGQHQARPIAMRVGVSRRLWVKNCIGVGLAGGFIEPLESTSIFCSQYGVAKWLKALRDHDDPEARRRDYNGRMRDLYQGIRDFVLLHYYLNGRDDSDFWRDNRERRQLPDDLRAIVDCWRRGGDELESLLAAHGSAALVGPVSWYCIFAGLAHLPAQIPFAYRRTVPPPAGAARELHRLSAQFPDQRGYLRAMAAPPA